MMLLMIRNARCIYEKYFKRVKRETFKTERERETEIYHRETDVSSDQILSLYRQYQSSELTTISMSELRVVRTR